jgi:hypothetical protein
MARSPSAPPEARQMERETRTTGRGKGCSVELDRLKASPLPFWLQALARAALHCHDAFAAVFV